MIGARIRQARLKADLTLDALRDTLQEQGYSITKAALSKYERDQSRVPATLLFKMARVLDVGMDYFLDQRAEVPIAFERFRKKARFGVRKQDQLKASVRDQVELYLELQDLVGEPVESPWSDFPRRPVATPWEAEEAAQALRKEWKLGEAPLESVCQLLEDKGFIVLGQGGAGDGFDGLSGVVGEPPRWGLVIYDPAKPKDRLRLSLAHELGHLMMDHPDDVEDKEREGLAYRFAGSFLVPPGVARRELGSRRNFLELEELAILKQKYGLSMLAWIRRAHDLGIIADNQYRTWCQVFAMRQWRFQEPAGYENPVERPTRRLRMTLRALGEGRITPKQADRLCPGVLEEWKVAPPGVTSLKSLLEEARAYQSQRLEAEADRPDWDPLEDLDLLESDEGLDSLQW